MKQPIGGYYESLIPMKSFDYHKEANYLTNGRACIRTIILNENITKCYIPNYTCDAVFHPFLLEEIDIEFYNINSYLKPAKLPELKKGEYFFYINYYGVKNDVVAELIKKYGKKLIIDNTHAFFQKKIEGNWSFTSSRKYFGVPDGAFLYSPKKVKNNYERFTNYNVFHNIERLKGRQSEGFKLYQDYEKSLNSEIKLISIYSEKMLSLVDIDYVIKKRKENFSILHEHLKSSNKFEFSQDENFVPFCYPYLPESEINKKVFYEENIFIPLLWQDPQNRLEISNQFELKLSKCLLPIPIDERYGKEDLERILDVIMSQK
jgi:hypothetical protein